MRQARSKRGFLGREAELAALAEMLRTAAGGDARFAVVAGAAGIGKTSLLERFESTAGGDVRVLRGSCPPLGEHGLPFAPIAEIARNVLADPELRESVPTRLGAIVRFDAATDDGLTNRTHVFQAVLELFERLAALTPLMIIIEDVHWADRSTLDLLSYLTPNLSDQRLLLVATLRTDDLVREHPARPILTELLRSPRVARLDLGALSADLVADQVELLSGHRPDADALSRLVERTEGNPFFVEQIVACNDDGAMSSTLRELLLVRADVVPPATRRTLRVMALTNGPVDEAAIGRIIGASVPEVREHVRISLDQHLLTINAGTLRFTHELLREVLADDILPTERREYHGAFAHELAAQLVSDTPPTGAELAGCLAQLAHHRRAAGDVEGAIEAWAQAADAADEVFAFAEAEQHLTAVIRHWQRVADADTHAGADLAAITARAADAAFLGGAPDRAAHLVRDAIRRVGPEADPRRLGKLHERLAQYLRDTDEHDEALGCAESAVALVPSDPPSPDRARVLAGLAGHLMANGRYADAKQRALEAIDVATLVGCDLARCDATITLGVVLATQDSVEAGLNAFRTSLPLAVGCGDPYQQMRICWNEFACLFDAGRWREALEVFDDAAELLPRLGQGHLMPELVANAADLHVRLGEWDEAERLLEAGRRRWGSDDLVQLDLLIGRGEFDHAREHIASRTTRNVFTDQEQAGWPLIHLAEIEMWTGRHDEARAAVDAALDITLDLDAPIATGYALAISCRVEADAAHTARLRTEHEQDTLALSRCAAHAEQIDDLLARPGPRDGWKREIGALAAQCAAELTRARNLASPASWVAATEAWEDLGAPNQMAYTLFRTAEAERVLDDDRTSATALLVRAHRIARSLGAEPLRHQIEAFGRRAQLDLPIPGQPRTYELTLREREVLSEVATGATNRQIAITLFISEKTASVHVSNILRKLGVANRGEAAALAHREGLSFSTQPW